MSLMCNLTLSWSVSTSPVAKFRREDERQQATEKNRPSEIARTITQNRQTYMSKRGVYICIERERGREGERERARGGERERGREGETESERERERERERESN